MNPNLESHQPEIAAICQRFHVRRLDLFGSAVREIDFGPESDFDFLVTYEPGHAPPALGDFLALRESLEALLRQKVDLTMASALRNPFIRAAIEASRLPLHGA